MDATTATAALPQIDNLPDDPKLLRAIIQQLLEVIGSLKGTVGGLQNQVELLTRRLYGRSSEKWDPNQLLMDAMLLKALEQRKVVDPAQVPQTTVKVPEHERKITPHGRGIFPATLPHEEEIIRVPIDQRRCPLTGQERPVIGYEESKKLHYVPGKLVVKVYKREKLGAVPGAEELGVVTAPTPQVLVPKGVLTNEALAQVVSDKFEYHLPLYRIEQRFAELGARVPRNTLCDNLVAGAQALELLTQAIHRKIIGNGVVHHDDSPVDAMVIGEDGKRHIKEGRMWVATVPAADGPWVEFKFATGRHAINIEDYFKGYAGKVCCDALKGYERIESELLVLCGCWAHTRRGFFEGKSVDTLECVEALGRIQEIYRIEASVAPCRENDAERLRVRRELVLPILTQFEERLLAWRTKALPKSPLGKASGYALNNWKRLTRFLEDPRVPLDNTAVEREIRRLAIGRNNWLFVGSEAGGRAAATYLTLIATAKRAGVDVKTYLRDTFARILDHSTGKLDELLPTAPQTPAAN